MKAECRWTPQCQKKKPSKLGGCCSISTPINFCRTTISFVPPLWEVRLHNDTSTGSFSWQNHTFQHKTVSLGSTGTAAERVALKQTAEGEDCNFHTKQRSSPGPKIRAPPCWAGSPWKSKAGPVIALHILLILPRSVFDFTWGLRTKQNGKILVI